VDAPARIGEIVLAIQILTHSPLIGRPVKGGRRELVIGRDSHGYVALYRFVASIDTVFVLAIRSQRESGHKHKH
jgi:toxin ParE1/3/4